MEEIVDVEPGAGIKEYIEMEKGTRGGGGGGQRRRARLP